MPYKLKYDDSEVSRCLLCAEPACTKACPQHADVGNILRSMYFDNYINVADKLNEVDCTYCNSPCEKECTLHGKQIPIKIRDIFMGMKDSASILPKRKLDDVDISADICGVKLENPFLLSSSVVASTYDMCARAFDAGWAGVAFKTICNFPQHESSPRFSAIYSHANSFCGFKNIEQLSD
ncbi:MAG: NAD-dependent dihydropyrimidine dehydrogenase subunit PreA, partial [Spirochaetales bacterium]|nr:NAD-dependent dihydropyrimidine dehydrogenase subunit PreA [Spirochaetales bacterium]